ncbi:hypothetical protein [Caballeronia sp. LZ035]|uniref:hypothetical protein n=1 Tax=Caballeronia sp. LZ035 TaxID=3038568 RepID=UPI0028616B9B|nr:hypothetical protein [Caballeronia sp. LZ035]MDR5759403.1 hypothetical protein [Caballeronia sp. LZ035]
MSAKQRFWRELFELKVHTDYIAGYRIDCEKKERILNILLALLSTSSLGIWAVFKAYPAIWAAIIVVTQIISAVSKYLPYHLRAKGLSSAVHEFDDHFIWAEGKWTEISSRPENDPGFDKSRKELQLRKAKTMKTHFASSLPVRQDIMDRAEASGSAFFQNFYGATHHDQSATYSGSTIAGPR